MNEKDDVILEYLASVAPSALPPTAIHYNITQRVESADFSVDTVRRRLKRLRAVGLVEIVREARNYHTITDLGKRYLAGEYKPDNYDSSRSS